MLHDEESWAFSDLVVAISAALHETFLLSKYANSVSQFCYIYKGFVRQLKAFPPSLCQFCACETSPGWGHLITWMDHSVGHLNGILARVGGNLNNNFQKSQMPGGLPGGGGHVEASIWPIHNLTLNCTSCCRHWPTEDKMIKTAIMILPSNHTVSGTWFQQLLAL